MVGIAGMQFQSITVAGAAVAAVFDKLLCSSEGASRQPSQRTSLHMFLVEHGAAYISFIQLISFLTLALETCDSHAP